MSSKRGAILGRRSYFPGFRKMLGLSFWARHGPARTSSLLLVSGFFWWGGTCVAILMKIKILLLQTPFHLFLLDISEREKGSVLIRSSRMMTPLSSQSVLYTSWQSSWGEFSCSELFWRFSLSSASGKFSVSSFASVIGGSEGLLA